MKISPPLRRLLVSNELLLVVTGFLLGVSLTITFMGQTQDAVLRTAYMPLQLPPSHRIKVQGGYLDGEAIKKQYLAPDKDLHWSDHHHGEEGVESKADVLARNLRVLCWVMTSPENVKSRARHVKATWGRRCNVLLFMSSIADDSLPAIGLQVPEGRSFLWAKTKAALTYVVHNHIDDADWFLKADDDTYVIVENLRHMLMDHDPSGLHYMGRRWRPEVRPQGYMSGGAGYVLSKAALLKLVNEALPDPKLCDPHQEGVEDLELGRCLMNIDVPVTDSRDDENRERFHPFDPLSMLIPGIVPKDTWYFDFNYNPVREGPDCCSDNSVTFHYVDPNWMYLLEYFVYHLHPYGVAKGHGQSYSIVHDNPRKDYRAIIIPTTSSSSSTSATTKTTPTVSSSSTTTTSGNNMKTVLDSKGRNLSSNSYRTRPRRTTGQSNVRFKQREDG